MRFVGTAGFEPATPWPPVTSRASLGVTRTWSGDWSPVAVSLLLVMDPGGGVARSGEAGLGVAGPGGVCGRPLLRSDGDGEFSAGVPGVEVADGLGHAGQRVGPADEGGDLAGFGQPAQGVEVGLAVLGDVGGQPLAGERGERQCPELPADSGPLAAFATGNDQGPRGR